MPVEQAPVVESLAPSSGINDLGQPPVAAAPNDPKPNTDDGNGDDPDDSLTSLTGPALPADAPPPGDEAQILHCSPSRLDDSRIAGANASSLDEARLLRLARMIRLEIVEPARALPFLSQTDYRVVEAYGQCYQLPACADGASQLLPQRPPASAQRWWQKWRRSAGSLLAREPEGPVTVVELITPSSWQRYENELLVDEGPNSLGQIPLVHVQNSAVPFEYSGASDVEPLIPLQDELNTRLSDRANRIALQSFKMYLGKRVPEFLTMPVSPGRMWTTDEPDADVIEFGGDANCPSEDTHISEIREALDKTSAVCPLAAGAIKNRLGQLTSAAALRITLMALLAKTGRKRTTYGLAIERMCELTLAWFDRAGLFPTQPQERRIEIHWATPLPENDQEKLQEASAKARLGVPREVLLRELGY